MELFIIVIISLVLIIPVFRFLEKRNYRWSRVVLFIMMTIGIFCIGIFAEL